MTKFNVIRILFLPFIITTLYSDSLTIIAVGDIMMGTTYPSYDLPPNNGEELFNDIHSVLNDADLTMGNLEGTLLTGGVSTKKVQKGRCYAFRTPPQFASNLAGAGFDFLNLANNHMNDFGHDGITSTMGALEEVGIEYGGPYRQIGHIAVGNTNIAVLCFSTSPHTVSLLDVNTAQRLVAKEARAHDLVIVSFHGGGEGLSYLHTRDTLEYYLGAPRGNVVAFAHAVIDSGADFVWGHGPHVPRALELYKNRLIAYSLGNFCTWGFNVSDERGYAPILKITFDSFGAFVRGEIVSAIQKNRQPLEIDSLHRAATLMHRLTAEDFPKTSLFITEQGALRRTERVPRYIELH
ncbi:hypothetical protein AMJ87_03015 [candidate division WOR_3 bacterium SM23_60]|uniref:Capsule synthesis protein CapA domain-containing protein n=1 Tax=candidate division WOR_3 bacterium SM23_60 TaxID=1703780 RepID=A0A0S8GJ26_UNCW3|nr:MAG: hypothetical protein AMJ87_03015 [candidate division WOR_3 bacterium SM23_60]